MASIIACPPPVADFTGRVDLHANGSVVGVYRDADGVEYLRVAPAASVDVGAARWFRIVPEPTAVPEPGPLIDADFGDPPPPVHIDDPDRDAEYLRRMRETVQMIDTESHEVTLAPSLAEAVKKTLAWLYTRLCDVCRECGCRRLTEVTVRSATGVRAPDGTREVGESTATICERCGTVAGGGVA